MKHLLIILISLLLTCLSCGDGDQQGKKRKVIGPVNSAPYELLVVCNKSWYKSDAGEVVYMDHPTEAGGVVFER